MPTARELLEQADALMRRNRRETARATSLPAAPEPPVRHAAAPVIDPGPRIVGPLPRPPAESPVDASVSTPPAIEAPVAERHAAAADEDIPLLEDAVAADDDEFPVLTEAVDEIEVAAPAIDEGEPSDWLEHPAGEESVFGVSPPSVVLVPPAMPEVRAERPSGMSGSSSAAWQVEPTPDIEDFLPEPVDPDVTIRRVDPAEGRFEPPAVGPALVERAAARAPGTDATDGGQRPLPVAAPIDTPTGDVESGTHPAQPPESGEAGVVPGSSGQRDVPTGAEREALAEEIRMQVLQRIDMFTDAGLRERLGERLKPIVDRASADLVDAINQHVGEILRAYVAEAIEREIDRWRSGR